MFCIFCFERATVARSAGYTCRLCWDELRLLKQGRSVDLSGLPESGVKVPVNCVYLYAEPLRPLILRIKTQLDWRAAAFAATLLPRHAASRELARWADIIVPAPSSLWSRLRGKLDLSYLLAQALAKRCHRRLGSVDFRLAFRWRKRAQEVEKTWSVQEVFAQTLRAKPLRFYREGKVISARRILIVDDIITSGLTLTTLAAAYRDHELRCLTLADAMGPLPFSERVA